MSSSKALEVYLLRVFAVLAGSIILACGATQESEPETAENVAEVETAPGTPLRVFYPGANGLLHLEERLQATADEDVSVEAAQRARARAVVDAVLGAPEDSELRRSFEEGTELAEIRLGSDGLVLVSLNPAPGSVNRGLSSRAELLRIYSLVNSLAYSVRGVQSVALIWAGSQPSTLGGHVDTSRPLWPSLDWVDSASKARLKPGSSAPQENGATTSDQPDATEVDPTADANATSDDTPAESTAESTAETTAEITAESQARTDATVEQTDHQVAPSARQQIPRLPRAPRDATTDDVQIAGAES